MANPITASYYDGVKTTGELDTLRNEIEGGSDGSRELNRTDADENERRLDRSDEKLQQATEMR